MVKVREGHGCDQTSENIYSQEPESKFSDPELFRRKQTDKAKHVAKEILVFKVCTSTERPFRVLPIESVLVSPGL